MAQENGRDFRKELPEVCRLGNMAVPRGLVYDPAAADTIIVGEKSGASDLSLDDFVSAARSIFVFGSYPQITIDPEGRNPESKWHCVRITRGIENSHFSQVLFESDYLLKKISLGLVKIKIPGFKTQYQLMIEKKKKKLVYSRFWFKPVCAEILVSKSEILIESYPVCVLTEPLHGGVRDESAVEFAESFTKRFDEFAGVMPVFGDLRNALRWVGIVSLISSLDFSPDLKFWLSDYEIKRVQIPERVKGLSNIYADLGFVLKVYGGVDSNCPDLKQKDAAMLAELARAVINSRPSVNSLTWEFLPVWQE